MGLRIIIEDYEGDTTIVPLEASGAPITVGRQEGNTIQLGEQNVSRAHARFIFDAERWVVEDLNSYNGIRVNGVLVDEGISLEEGDVIQVGDYRLLFCSDKNKSANDVEDLGAQNDSEDHRSTMVMMGNTITPEQILSAMPAKDTTIGEGQPTKRSKKNVDTQRNTIEQVVAEVENPNPSAEPEQEEKAGTSTAIKGTMVALALSGLAALVFFLPEPNSEKQVSGSEVVVALGQGSDTASSDLHSKGTPSIVHHHTGHDSTSIKSTIQKESIAPVSNIGEGASQRDGSIGADQDRLSPMDDATVWPIGTVLDEPGRESNSGDKAASDAARRKRSSVDRDKRRSSLTSSASSGRRSEGSRKNRVNAGELLQKAREASIAGKPSLAYRLAKKSFDASRSTDALQLMGVSACKMGKKKLAKEVLNRLRGAKKKNLLRAFCSSNGIDLG